MRIQFFVRSLTAVGALFLLQAQSAKRFVFQHENVLGTSFEIKVDASSMREASAAEQAALAEIDRQSKILSGYDPQSEFSKWLKTSNVPIPVSSDLYNVLALFDQWRERSGGALNASAEGITRVWKNAAKSQHLPEAEALRQAVQLAAQKHWLLDPANQTATHLTSAPLVLNSFAKSYIGDHAASAAMTVPGVRAVVLNLGGDLVVRGSAHELVSILDPRSAADNGAAIANLMLTGTAVATSGDYRRGVDIAGKHYSHIVDPRTGQPAGDIISSTVVAKNPAAAGALATAFSVLKVEESQRLAATLPGIEYLLVTKSGERITSPGWQSMLAPRVQLSAAPAPQSSAGPVWNPAMELTVNFELSLIEGQRTRRPYVAVWVEDKANVHVRTLALWYSKPRWLPDLKSWYRGERVDTAASVSSATRSPGKYSLKWDGKDDKGNPVKPGKFTVCIEAAREHGTYQLMCHEMDFNATPQSAKLTGNLEVAAASLDYGKKQ